METNSEFALKRFGSWLTTQWVYHQNQIQIGSIYKADENASFMLHNSHDSSPIIWENIRTTITYSIQCIE